MKALTKTELNIKKFTDSYRKRIDKLTILINSGEGTKDQHTLMVHNRAAYKAMISDLEYAMFYNIKKDALIFPDGYFA